MFSWPVLMKSDQGSLINQICDFVVEYQLVNDTSQLSVVSLYKFQDHTRE